MEIFIEYLNTTTHNWWESQLFLTFLGAVLGAIIPIILTYLMNTKQEKRNEEFQKNINKSNNEFQQDLKKMEIDADITARSRIEWIQNARNTTVDFMNSCYNLIGFMGIIEIGESKQEIPKKGAIAKASITIEEKTSEKFEAFGSEEKNIYVEQGNVQKYGTLLSLYFGPDEEKENEFIIYLIENIIKKLVGSKTLFEDHNKQIIDMMEDLKNALRTYYKVEWKRANGSFQDDEVNKKLNSEETYKYIKNKYEVPFKNWNNSKKVNISYELVNDKYIEINE